MSALASASARASVTALRASACEAAAAVAAAVTASAAYRHCSSSAAASTAAAAACRRDRGRARRLGLSSRGGKCAGRGRSHGLGVVPTARSDVAVTATASLNRTDFTINISLCWLYLHPVVATSAV